jgi:ribonucleotide reductase beta subunit family protein with ferritin-like domain
MNFQPLMPATRMDLNEMYIKARSMIWFESEIQFTSDLPDYSMMTADERHFIELILGFFAVSDRIVLSNLVENFIREVNIPEAQLFYNVQAFMEDIHSLTYTNHLLTLVKDPARIDQLLNSIQNFPSIAKKAAWASKWMNRDAPIQQRLVAFAIVEAVYFSASFCSIFWLKTQNKLVKGVGTSNEFISRDENLHADFACMLYTRYYPSIEKEIIIQMIQEAVDVESEFVREALPGEGFVGMNANLMLQYVQYVADRLGMNLGLERAIFGAENPFPFMANLSLNGKTNFFEKRVTEYSKVNVSSDSLHGLEDF